MLANRTRFLPLVQSTNRCRAQCIRSCQRWMGEVEFGTRALAFLARSDPMTHIRSKLGLSNWRAMPALQILSNRPGVLVELVWMRATSASGTKFSLLGVKRVFF